jgi:hypothetical protein
MIKGQQVRIWEKKNWCKYTRQSRVSRTQTNKNRISSVRKRINEEFVDAKPIRSSPANLKIKINVLQIKTDFCQYEALTDVLLDRQVV